MDDNSPDGTQDQAKKLQELYGKDKIIHAFRPKKLGLGTAYLHALKFATGQFVILLDADLSHHVNDFFYYFFNKYSFFQPKFIPTMIKRQIETNSDVVTGSRYRSGGGVAGWNFTRKIISSGANYVATVLLRPGVTDLTGSFRLYRREVLESLLPKVTMKGYVFQLEIIFLAKENGFKVSEVCFSNFIFCYITF